MPELIAQFFRPRSTRSRVCRWLARLASVAVILLAMDPAALAQSIYSQERDNNDTQGPPVLVDASDGVQFLDMNQAGVLGGLFQVVAATVGNSYHLTLDTTAWATTPSAARSGTSFTTRPPTPYWPAAATPTPLAARGYRAA